MTTFESYSDALHRAGPLRKPFNGTVREAVNENGKLTDLNRDGQTDLADALNDGQLSHKEYNALLELHGVADADRTVFNHALATSLAGKVPGALSFVEQVEALAQGDDQTALHLYGTSQANSYQQADVVTGHLQIQITDHNGFAKPAKDDLDLNLNGSLTVKTDMPKDFNLPPIASPYQNGIQFGIMGMNLLSLTFKTQDKDSLLVITPPSPKVLGLAQSLGIKLPAINTQTVADMLGVPVALVKLEGPLLTVSSLALLQHKYPHGLPFGGKKLQINTLDLSGMAVTDVQIKPEQVALKLKFNQVNLGAGMGTATAQRQAKEKLTVNLATKDLNLSAPKEMSLISSAQIELGQMAEALQNFIAQESQGQLKNIQVTWKDNQMTLAAQGQQAPFKAVIPVKVVGNALQIDCSGLKVLGLPLPLAAARLNQYLSNTTPFQSKVEGNTLWLNADELLVKQFPDLAKSHRIEALNIHKGNLTLTMTRNPHEASVYQAPQSLPPVHPPNIMSPFVGATTQGDALVGLGYTRAIPLGRSPLGQILGLKPETGTIPHLSYSYLDNTYSGAVSIATDGTLRGDVSTGLRASATPIGLPLYAQVEPLGIGIATSKAGTHAYLPMKIGTGYDNGRLSAGVFYQHNFGLGGADDNILGVAGGVRW